MTAAPPTLCAAPGCGKPSADAYLCRASVRRLEKMLAQLPAQLDDLQVTIARQSNAGSRDGGKPTKASAQPLPLDVRTGHLADLARVGLTSVIRHLCASQGLPLPNLTDQARVVRLPVIGPVHPACLHSSCRDFRVERMPAVSVQSMALWLTAHVDDIARDEAAGEIYAKTDALRHALSQAVDNQERTFAGLCTAKITVAVAVTLGPVSVIVPELVAEPKTCGQPLHTRPGAKLIRCNARDEDGNPLGCGAQYQPGTLYRDAVDQADDEYGTATFLAHALTSAGYRVTPERIRKWAQRSREWLEEAKAWKEGDPPLAFERHPIVSDRQDDVGRPLYRLGDVRDRLTAEQRHPSERVSA